MRPLRIEYVRFQDNTKFVSVTITKLNIGIAKNKKKLFFGFFHFIISKEGEKHAFISFVK